MDPESFLDRLRRRFAGLPRLARWWWLTGALLIAGNAVFSSVEGVGCLQVFFIVFLVFWAVPTTLYVTWWIWRKLTYRISVRLFLSYLLIGVLPFPILLFLSAGGDYLWLGQYTSAEFGDTAGTLRRELEDFAVAAASDEAPVERLEAGPDLPEELVRAALHIAWLHREDGEIRRGGGSATAAPDDALTVPEWAPEGTTGGLFLAERSPILAAITRRGERITVAYLPLEEQTAKALSEGNWYAIQFADQNVEVRQGNITISPHREDSVDEADENTDTAPSEDAPPGPGAAPPEAAVDEPETKGVDSGTGWIDAIWTKRWILFFRLSPEPRRWSDGETMPERSVTTILKTSPQEALVDLFRSPYELGRVTWAVFLAFCLFFAAVYLVAVALAAIQIVAITRSTARLTVGARQVEAGRLDYRIPVRRRDQLGDLAVAYNRMTESVEHMLDEVAEKERLKNELELAREIQQSLLPARELTHGGIAVHAYFRPAAEVGGDYFDLFPLPEGRLIVAAGDVAGHGLPTGLLMAMVKSMVATLIEEGHHGPELLERVNRLMLQQPREHRMLTLALADIDPVRRSVEITNAAHPPIFLTGDEVREILLPALPVGYRWRQRPPTRKLDLVPEARLVFYSDGLVEAVDEQDEPFGYETLRELLQAKAELPSAVLLQTILAALDEHTGGRALEDDLTILIIDCGVEEEDSSEPAA